MAEAHEAEDNLGPERAGESIRPIAGPASRLAQARASGLAAAGEVLAALGFSRSEDGDWHGTIPVRGREGDQTLPIRIAVPEAFPDQLPSILTLPGTLPAPLEHVEANGKVCIVQEHRVLLDTEHPRDLINESLARAAAVISRALSGETAADLAAEFLAYWEKDARTELWTIATRSRAPSQGGQLYAARFDHRPDGDTKYLLADSEEQAQRWSERLGVKLSSVDEVAYLLPLVKPPTPPAFGRDVSVGQWLATLRAAADPVQWRRYQDWLSAHRLPGILAFAFLTPESAVPTLGALRLGRATGDRRKQATRGFRKGHLRADHELGFTKNDRLARFEVIGVDAEYITRRGGASPLTDKRVVLIGCGSIGSHIAMHVGALGVGMLDLLDKETLTADNVHRHVLGVDSIGAEKAPAVAALLSRMYPHQQAQGSRVDVLDLVETDAKTLVIADLLVIALGDETLERRLNETLAHAVPRIHAWLEPLGVGGHVLGMSLPRSDPSRGCYECLFRRTDEGLTNRASLVAPGQSFGRSLAGCAGTHNPFSAIDASRTAIEAASLVQQILVGTVLTPRLVSWRGMPGAFEQERWRLSSRGEGMIPGSVQAEDAGAFSRIDCKVCGTSS